MIDRGAGEEPSRPSLVTAIFDVQSIAIEHSKKVIRKQGPEANDASLG